MAKIVNVQEIKRHAHTLEAEGKVIVFATGVFDLLHPGHVVFLQKAKTAGDILIVGVESDTKARRAKGSGRPILSQEERVKLVSALAAVDYVIPLPTILDNDRYRAVCRRVHAKKLAITAGDPYEQKKRAIMAAIGGMVVVVTKRFRLHSTSKLVQKIQRQYVAQA